MPRAGGSNGPSGLGHLHQAGPDHAARCESMAQRRSSGSRSARNFQQRELVFFTCPMYGHNDGHGFSMNVMSGSSETLLACL